MRLCKLQKATYAPQYPTTGFSCAARSSKPALVAISILITELARTAGLTAGAYETEAALSIIRVSSKENYGRGVERGCIHIFGHHIHIFGHPATGGMK